MATQMIFAKINPQISLVQQTNPFNQNVTFVTGSYMTAIATPYVLGSDSTQFRVLYGNCEFDEAGYVVGFETVHSQGTTLSGETIEDWGTDDVTILEAIADENGVSIASVVSGSIQNNGMFF